MILVRLHILTVIKKAALQTTALSQKISISLDNLYTGD